MEQVLRRWGRGTMLGLVALALCWSQPCWGGETSLYLKSGWFDWGETLEGASFVKERGALHGAGITRRDQVSALTVAESMEVWGGLMDYRGHDVTGASELNSDTVYLGTREELELGLRVPLAERLVLEPLVGVGHRFWTRSRSSEDWNSLYLRGGLSAEAKLGMSTWFAQGGFLAPFYTRNHANLAAAGFTDVVTRPKTLLSPWAEAGMRRGHYALSFEYEELRFGQSESIPTSRLSTTPGTAIVNRQAFQPKSDSHRYSLKLSYYF